MIKTPDGKYQCIICNIQYAKDIEAVTCESGHDLVYVPFNREDLFKLIQFLYTKDDSLLSESLMKTLLKYKRGFYR